MQAFSAAKHFGTILLALVGWITVSALLVQMLHMIMGMVLDLNFYFVLLSIIFLIGLWLVFVYFFWAIYSLRYMIDTEVLRIRWGFVNYQIPLADIKVKKVQSLKPAAGGKRTFLTSGFPYRLGLILLQTSTREIVISPANQVAFLSTLYKAIKLRQVRIREFPEQASDITEDMVTYPFQKQLSCFQDKGYSVLFSLNLLVTLCFLGFVFAAIGSLPRFTVLRYSVNWGIDIIGAREDLAVYIFISLALLLVSNLVAFVTYRIEKVAAYISLGFYPFTQAGLCIAILGLLKMA